MPNWKFWEKTPAEPLPPSAAPEPARRFTAKPRTDLPGVNSNLGQETVAKLNQLRTRREAVLFDVEQALLATQPENPWLERVRLLDEAIDDVRSDRDRAQRESEPIGEAVTPAPLHTILFQEGPPPSVAFDLLEEHFIYAEEIDWAERGYQLARGDLLLQSGEPQRLVEAIYQGLHDEAFLEHITASLFVFASDTRDRALAGEVLPVSVTLADLARPDETAGGWFDWNGHSAAATRRDHRVTLLQQEEQRLLAERERELQEQARWEDRLPIAKRRLADVDAEIAALEV